MTVLEVVVALVVAGTFLAILLPSATQASSHQRSAELRIRASALAASKIEEITQGNQLRALPSEGLENRLKWRIDVIGNERTSGSSMEVGTSLKTYTVSVASEKGDPIIALSVQRMGTQR